MKGIHRSIAARHGDRIATALRENPRGLTDFELAERLGMYLSSVNAARNSLLRKGIVAATAERRPSGRGGMATVWRVVA